MNLPKKCRIKEGWFDAGKEGTLHAVVEIGDRKWAVVEWPDDADPDLQKAESIEVAVDTWRPVV